MKVFIVTAEHWEVPGRHMRAFSTLEKAEVFAAREVNDMLKESGATWIVDCHNWLSGLEWLEEYHGAQHVYVEVQECGIDAEYMP